MHFKDLDGLKDIYAPQKVIPFTLPPAGIDNLALSSDDIIMLPGGSKVDCHFEGYFRVARAKPTKKNWATGEVYVNMIEINLRGSIPKIGDISVSLNPDFISAGQTFPGGASDKAASCRIAAGALFDIPGMSILFNKEPILLMNDAIKAIPPVEDPNGEARLYKLPLFRSIECFSEPISMGYPYGSAYVFEYEINRTKSWNIIYDEL